MTQRTVLAVTTIAACILAPPAMAAGGRIPIYGQTTITSPGTYQVTRDFTVSSGTAIVVQTGNVTIDLDGHTITSTDLSSPVIHANGFSPVRVSNGRIVGGHDGVRLEAFEGRFLAEDLYLSDQAGTAILVGGGGNSNHAVIVGNTIHRPADYGIALSFLVGARIERNVVTLAGKDGVYVSAVGNVSLRANNVANSNEAGLHLVFATHAAAVGDNVFAFNGGSGILVGDTIPSSVRNNAIDGNLCESNQRYGLEFLPAATGNIYGRNRTPGNALGGVAPGAGNLDAGGNLP